MNAAAHPSERAVAEELRLNPGRPQVARLSRKALIVLTSCSAIAIVGAAVGIFSRREFK